MAILVARKRTVGMTLVGKAAFSDSRVRSGKRALAHKQALSEENL